MAAPLCVARASTRSRCASARSPSEHGVPVVENPPLARALYESVDLDEEIPVEHYKAVAEVIGYRHAAAAEAVMTVIGDGPRLFHG